MIPTIFGARRSQPPWRVAIVCRDRRTSLAWYWAQVAQAAVETLGQAGCLVRVITTEGKHPKSAAFLRWLRGHGVDGAIDFEHDWVLRRGAHLEAWRFPIVCAWQLPTQAAVAADQVAVDEAAVARLALEHLRALGHRRCGYVVVSKAVPVETRFALFQQEAKRLQMWDPSLALDLRAHLGNRISVVPDFGRSKTALQFFRRQRKPFAVFTHHDYVAASLIETLLEQGYQVPGEVAVVGVDDDPLYSLANQGLTTLQLPARAQGSEAARLLLSRLHHPRGPLRCVKLPPKLVVRPSTVGRCRDTEWLLQVIEEMRKSYHEANVLRALRLQTGLNRKTLERRFRQAMGCTLLEYRDRMRMERASQLFVENPRAKISSAAREVGFTVAGRFAAMFRERFGVAPAKYRQCNMGRG
ncbi:MAG: substrate-binding domain-containing protein [Verrucomicrobia bacterium]|nr:substrate-binding domain-containing protein [Verrucomicrobiota bacterium]